MYYPDQVSPEEARRYAKPGVPPHCDADVVHAPGECVFCDVTEGIQAAREAAGTNYTGHTDPDKLPCPSDARRGVGGAHVWGGNRPVDRVG